MHRWVYDQYTFYSAVSHRQNRVYRLKLQARKQQFVIFFCHVHLLGIGGWNNFENPLNPHGYFCPHNMRCIKATSFCQSYISSGDSWNRTWHGDCRMIASFQVIRETMYTCELLTSGRVSHLKILFIYVDNDGAVNQMPLHISHECLIPFVSRVVLCPAGRFGQSSARHGRL